MIDTRFWDDAYIARLAPAEKLAFLYLLTSPLANIAGAYELPMRRAVFDTGLPEEDLGAALTRFEADGKLVRRGDWVGVVNFVRHQSLNPSVRQGIRAGLSRAPGEIVAALRLPPGAESLLPGGLTDGSFLKTNAKDPGPQEGPGSGPAAGRARFLSMRPRFRS